ncbi:hypothetical protein SEVIR_3G261200v4 [Setaria viridis]
MLLPATAAVCSTPPPPSPLVPPGRYSRRGALPPPLAQPNSLSLEMEPHGLQDGEGFVDFFSQGDSTALSSNLGGGFSQPEASLVGRSVPSWREDIQGFDLNSYGLEFPNMQSYQDILQSSRVGDEVVGGKQGTGVRRTNKSGNGRSSQRFGGDAGGNGRGVVPRTWGDVAAKAAAPFRAPRMARERGRGRGGSVSAGTSTRHAAQSRGLPPRATTSLSFPAGGTGGLPNQSAAEEQDEQLGINPPVTEQSIYSKSECFGYMRL